MVRFVLFLFVCLLCFGAGVLLYPNACNYEDFVLLEGDTLIYQKNAVETTNRLQHFTDYVLPYWKNVESFFKRLDVPSTDILEIGVLILIVLLALLLLTRKKKSEKPMKDNVRKLQDYIDADPAASVEIIRKWLKGGQP